MTLNVPAIVAAVESHASTTGLFERIVTTEPKSAPGKGLSAAIWFGGFEPVPGGSGLDALTVRVTMMLRVLKPMLSQPYGQIDPDMMTALDTLLAAYCNAFTLDGLIRNVDLLGQHGVQLSAKPGYVTIEQQMYRIVDVTLPLIVNDLWVETP